MGSAASASASGVESGMFNVTTALSRPRASSRRSWSSWFTSPVWRWLTTESVISCSTWADSWKRPIVVSAAMRILVTGLSGFIGSSLGPFLEARGHEVRGAGRDVTALTEALPGCDAVVHLANIAHARVEAELLRRVNVEGTARVAALAADQGVGRFVYLSSIKANQPQDAYGQAKLAAEQALRRTAAAS